MALPRVFAGVAALLVWVVAVLHLPVGSGSPRAWALFALVAVLGGTSVVLGLVVAWRRPHNVVGLLLVLVGSLPLMGGFTDTATAPARTGGQLLQLGLALSAGSWMALYALPALLVLFFPDGKLPGRRWRPVAVGLVAVPVVFDLLAAVDPAPYPPPYAAVPHPMPVSPVLDDVLGVLGFALLPVFLGLLVASVASIVVRYRRAPDRVYRAQLTWLVLGAAFLPATLLLGWGAHLFLGGGELLVTLGLGATYLAIPVATAIAILRHDLYDVDKVASAATTYGLLTALLLGCYALASFLVGVVAGRSSPVTAAAATAVAALALAPVRLRLQRLVERRLYPRRQAALGAIEQLRSRVDAGTARPDDLEPVLQEALRDPDVRVGYRRPGLVGLVDAEGRSLVLPSGAHAAPVLSGGAEIGALYGSAAESPELLRDLAAASALLVEVVRLRIELSRALDEAETSRARLLQAGYSERKRLERDLHDGAQQRLVSLGMGLRLAQRHLGDPDVDQDAVLDGAVAELALAVGELRQIAHGLRPSSLDDGLDHALTAMASKAPVPVRLHLQMAELADDLATTAYYVANEALTNAVKHAGSAAIEVRVQQDGDRLTVAVRDDGRGGATLRPGTGLSGIADRVAAAGGSLRLLSREGQGTLVEAVLPCGS